MVGEKPNKNMSSKVIARIMGGLGNQMFCYAAARRMALANDAELVLDDETAFSRDHQYQRKYSLTAFTIAGRQATSAEKFKPFEQIRRKVAREISHRRPFEKRAYIDQFEGEGFDPRLLDRRVRDTLWLDGYWQGEGYFVDIADTIRADFKMAPITTQQDHDVASQMAATNSVAVHLRWFDNPGSKSRLNVSPDYYRSAFKVAVRRLESPHFFVFSDNPKAARIAFDASSKKTTFVTHNSTAHDGALADFRLMRYARHFIIANSSFSWWAAWLGEATDKLVIAPSTKTVTAPSWTLNGLLPKRWLKI